MNIAIIGGGIAGLTTAKHLTGICNLTVFDKSRGVSGRMSTRYADPFQFDHGAQYFTAESDEFKRFLSTMQKNGSIAEWQGRLGTIGSDGFLEDKGSKTRWVGSPKMNTLAKKMAEGLNLKLGTHIQRFERDAQNHLILIDGSGQEFGPYDHVISAMPHPQLIDFLKKSEQAADRSLETVKMSGCYSLMLGGRYIECPAFDGAKVSNGAIGWVAVNSRKPGRKTAPSILIQSSNIWADQHIDADQDWVKAELLKQASNLLGVTLNTAEYTALHRWRYAHTDTPLGAPFWRSADASIYATGDWCLGGDVESGFLSGLALANHLAGSKTD